MVRDQRDRSGGEEEGEGEGWVALAALAYLDYASDHMEPQARYSDWPPMCDKHS